MKLYKITIEETIVEEFEVKANSKENALKIAKEKYRNSEFVVTQGEVHYKQIAITSPSEDTTEWEVF